jgi:hypothetical protein
MDRRRGLNLSPVDHRALLADDRHLKAAEGRSLQQSSSPARPPPVPLTDQRDEGRDQRARATVASEQGPDGEGGGQGPCIGAGGGAQGGEGKEQAEGRAGNEPPWYGRYRARLLGWSSRSGLALAGRE